MSNTPPEFPKIEPHNVQIPSGQSFKEWIESRTARYETRTVDWNALKFQADFDSKYKRAQMRYIGTGGSGVTSDPNVVPADHFTFSTMVLPAGCEAVSYTHLTLPTILLV